MIGGEEGGGVDGDAGDGFFFTDICGEIVPQRLNRGIFFSFLYEQADYREISGGIFVDEMDDHVVLMAADFFFAGMMEMELDESVLLAADGDAVAGIEIDLDRVAVVDDFQGRGLVIELDRGEIGFFGAFDIDGRLALAVFAKLPGGIEIAPVIGAVGAGIAPVGRMIVVSLGESGLGGNGEDKDDGCE